MQIIRVVSHLSQGSYDHGPAFSIKKTRSSCSTINYQLGIWEYVDDVLLPMEQNNETFFPKSIKNYQQCFALFKTDYEVGLRNELKKLDRTTIIYKFDDKILLHLFLDELLQILTFFKLKREGMIHDLHVSIPIYWHSKYF